MQKLPAINYPDLKRKWLAPRTKNCHKGDFGHVAVIGGDVGMSGAVMMAARSAYRTGAGLVSIITHSQHAAFVNLTQPEIMVQAYEHSLAFENHRATVLAVGCGMGRNIFGADCFEKARKSTKLKIVDADGLWFLAQQPQHDPHWILTPHPKEAATLLGIDNQTVQKDRVAALKALQKKYGGVIVLKGAGTLVGFKDTIHYCQAGNPGMASGGMGDVLTGIIAGLLAQGIPAYESACLGVAIHANAADTIKQQQGERGMVATDLLMQLPNWVN